MLGFYTEYVWKDIDDNILESIRPLYKFFSKLKTKSTRAFDPIFLEENDRKLTQLLKKHNLIDDPNAPVILVGDRNIISNLVYKPGVPPEKSKMFTYEFDVEGLESNWTKFKKDLQLTFYKDKPRTSSMGEKIDFGPYKGF